MPTTIAAPRNARLDALPNRSRDRHGVRLAGGREKDDARRPGGPSGAPGGKPAPFPIILSSLRVLVVDDDPDSLDLFAAALSACGAEVSATDNAADALALAVQVRPHVIVSDIAMVGEDGYWLVRALRALPADSLPNVPVIAATAYGREHPRSRVLAAGFTEHLEKPVDPEALCQIVAKMAGR
ncbi:MAG TPA: response regulator [Methylomirabilota bacterium]|jgi:CheY-like chemotaxis protein|nr:response regulator [Methylomirabilota bacterium]